MNELLQLYLQGAISEYQFALDALHMLDPLRPELVLEGLPHEIHREILEYAKRYDPRGTLPARRILPTIDQVSSATKWIDAHDDAQSRFAVPTK